MPRAAHSGPTIAKAAKSRAYGASGVRVALSVLGADDSGEAKLTYRWAATGTAPVVFSANDSNAAQSTIATVVAAGEYQFTATITDPSGRSTKSTTTYAVTHKQASIVVNPARTEVAEEGVQRFSATAYDQFNHRLAKQPSFAWSVARTGVGGKGGSRQRDLYGARLRSGN